MEVAVHGVPDVAIVASERSDRIANVWRGNVFPIEVGGVASNGEIEPGYQRFPELREAVVETLDESDFRAQRPCSRDDFHDGEREDGDETVDRLRPVRPTERASRERLHETRHRTDIGPFELLKQPVRGLGQPEAQ